MLIKYVHRFPNKGCINSTSKVRVCILYPDQNQQFFFINIVRIPIYISLFIDIYIENMMIKLRKTEKWNLEKKIAIDSVNHSQN